MLEEEGWEGGSSFLCVSVPATLPRSFAAFACLNWPEPISFLFLGRTSPLASMRASFLLFVISLSLSRARALLLLGILAWYLGLL